MKSIVHHQKDQKAASSASDSLLQRKSIDKTPPCSLLGGLAQFIEPWLGEPLRRRLVPCKLDAVHGAVLMIRKAVQPQPMAEIDRK